jgi:hypothetical protein
VKQHAPSVYNSAKSAWKALVQTIGGIDAVAACTRANRAMASEYGSPHSQRFVPVDVLLDAEAVAEMPLVTAALARAQGYELVVVVPRDCTELAVDLARIGRDTSDLFGRAVGVLAGEKLDAATAQAMLADLDDLIDVARLTRDAVRRRSA